VRKIRLISRLDIKGENVIKGIQMEGLRIVGQPAGMSRHYYSEGIDEILFIDTVASLYGRNQLIGLITEVSEEIFVPLVVAGGIRSLDDFCNVLKAGADKVAINTHALENPNLIREASKTFGSQCVVLSVKAKRTKNGKWEAYCENGRQATGRDVQDWIREAVDLGGGEILLTSVDKDGTMGGMDIQLYKTISETISVPVIASGGAGKVQHIIDIVLRSRVSAVAVAAMFHFSRSTVQSIKLGLLNQGIEVRVA